MSEELIKRLNETKNAIDEDLSFLKLSLEDKTQNYLYFATQRERMNIYIAEKPSRKNFSDDSLRKEHDFEIKRLQPVFEDALKAKGLITIANLKLDIQPLFEKGLQKILAELVQIERKQGTFIALITLRSWAYSKNLAKCTGFRGRLAASYLQLLVQRLETELEGHKELMLFLAWCGRNNQPSSR